MSNLRNLRSLVPKVCRGTILSPSLKARQCLLTKAVRTLSTRPHQVQEWDDGHFKNIHQVGSVLEERQQNYNVEDLLPLHPYTMHSPQFKFPNKHKKKQLSMKSFLEELPAALQIRKQTLLLDSEAFVEQEDPVQGLFGKLKFTRSDWAPYAHADPTRAYTRNLIYTDNENYTLLLLCWNAGVESKIHDHPCDGCWLQVLQGEIVETRYETPPEGESNGHLKCMAEERFVAGQLAFINDNIGLHKIGNPSPDIPAVTLHLYHPPFQRCRVWDDSSSGNPAKSSCAVHFSEYGWVEGSALP